MDNKRHLHGSFTFKVEQADNGSFVASIIQETKHRENDDVGALYYVIVVIMIYGCSILMMIASYIRKNKMDRKLNRYLKEMANVRKRERQFQMFTAAKKAAAAREMLSLVGSNGGGGSGGGGSVAAGRGGGGGGGDAGDKCHQSGQNGDNGGNHHNGDPSTETGRPPVIRTAVSAEIEIDSSDKQSVSSGKYESSTASLYPTPSKKHLRSQDRASRVQIMCTPKLLNPSISDTETSAAEDSMVETDREGEEDKADDADQKEMDRLEVVVDDISANTETNSECSFLGSLLSADTSPSDESGRLTFSGVQIVSSV